MEVMQVLHMNGGNGETSYASNSLLQRNVIAMTKPITEEAIVNLYCSNLPTTLSIADLGCSSGPNTTFVVSELIKTVHLISKKLGNKSPEYQIYLNDLPGNDFNSIFKSLPKFQEGMREQLGFGFGPCFVTGVPGSFYGRLFPTKSLHFVHSSYSLMWLSQVPEGLEGNKGNIYLASTSPKDVVKAYQKQFQKDFSVFLKCRSEELVVGGRMVLTFLARKSEDPCSKECCSIWELLATALNELVTKGVIEEEKMDTFNIPQYTPSPTELKSEFSKEGSFSIDRLEVSQVSWDVVDDDHHHHHHNGFCPCDEFKDGGYYVAKYMRAVAEPMLVSHFGEGIIDQVFRRYREIISDRMSRERTEFINITVSVQKI